MPLYCISDHIVSGKSGSPHPMRKRTTQSLSPYNICRSRHILPCRTPVPLSVHAGSLPRGFFWGLPGIPVYIPYLQFFSGTLRHRSLQLPLYQSAFCKLQVSVMINSDLCCNKYAHVFAPLYFICSKRVFISSSSGTYWLVCNRICFAASIFP